MAVSKNKTVSKVFAPGTVRAIPEAQCLSQSIHIINSNFITLSARNNYLAITKISNPVYINPKTTQFRDISGYEGNILTWNSDIQEWDALPFQGFGDIAARAWVVFKVTNTGPKILAQYNVQSVINDPNQYPSNTNPTGQYLITLHQPLEVPEACTIVSGCLPSEFDVTSNCPEGAAVGITIYEIDEETHILKAPLTKTKLGLISPAPVYGRLPSPEEVYVQLDSNNQPITEVGPDGKTRNVREKVPERYRKTVTVIWRPVNGGCPDETIISAIVYARSFEPFKLNPNPVETVLGYDIRTLI